mgnify:CR=1 FL=1
MTKFKNTREGMTIRYPRLPEKDDIFEIKIFGAKEQIAKSMEEYLNDEVSLNADERRKEFFTTILNWAKNPKFFEDLYL